MNVKSQDSPKPWVDPDDAPELTDDFFEQGEWKIGEQLVSASEGAAALREALSRGKGWQTRMNDALKDGLQTHSLA